MWKQRKCIEMCVPSAIETALVHGLLFVHQYNKLSRAYCMKSSGKKIRPSETTTEYDRARVLKQSTS